MITTIQQRINDILYNNFDGNSGENVTLKKVDKFWDGTLMTDSKCDNVMYFKSGTEYFRRSHPHAIDVRWYGALGNNDPTTNIDKVAIQAAIDNCPKNGTVVIYEDMICQVSRLDLKSDMTFICLGKLIQSTAGNQETFNAGNQDSDLPLISGVGISNVVIQMNCTTNYEAIRLINCTNIVIKNSSMNGNRGAGGFSGIAMYLCNHINIHNNEIYNFGPVRDSVTTYPNGRGVSALNGDYLTISGNNIHDNGNNGIFTITCRYVKIDQNEIKDNGLSGIQVAFSGEKTERDYLISNNKITGNKADAIDINYTGNPATPNNPSDLVDLKAFIFGNVTDKNGFVGNLPTPDGSGIATLIRVTNVFVMNNQSTNSNKPGIYMNCCGYVNAVGNRTDNSITIEGSFDRLSLQDNVIGQSITVIPGASGTFLNVERNKFTSMGLPNDITIGQLLVKENFITACNINLKLNGWALFQRNRIENNVAGNNSFYIDSVSNGLTIEDNTIYQNADSICINIKKAVRDIRIINNRIFCKNVLIMDTVGAPYLVVEGNRLTGLAGGIASPATYSGTPSDALLRNNTHDSVGNAVSVSSGTLFLDHESHVSGTHSYVGTTVKTASYCEQGT